MPLHSRKMTVDGGKMTEDERVHALLRDPGRGLKTRRANHKGAIGRRTHAFRVVGVVET